MAHLDRGYVALYVYIYINTKYANLGLKLYELDGRSKWTPPPGLCIAWNGLGFEGYYIKQVINRERKQLQNTMKNIESYTQ